MIPLLLASIAAAHIVLPPAANNATAMDETTEALSPPWEQYTSSTTTVESSLDDALVEKFSWCFRHRTLFTSFWSCVDSSGKWVDQISDDNLTSGETAIISWHEFARLVDYSGFIHVIDDDDYRDYDYDDGFARLVDYDDDHDDYSHDSTESSDERDTDPDTLYQRSRPRYRNIGLLGA